MLNRYNKNHLELLVLLIFDKVKRKILKKTDPVENTWRRKPGRFHDTVSFLNWFDATDSVQSTLALAKSDWTKRFSLEKEFLDLPKKRALEIGFGGGRLLLEAAKIFETVIGIDIHESFVKTEGFLASQECNNFSLLSKEQLEFVEDETVDFVYSFIVFQHFASFQEVEFYLNHIKRILTKSGYAHIYFGKTSEPRYVEISEENFTLRGCSLLINPTFLKELIKKEFVVLDVKERVLKNPDLEGQTSMQASIKFCRKA
jgi:ubiquinone/menaquinone biosynthesis C-methylase UbiE